MRNRDSRIVCIIGFLVSVCAVLALTTQFDSSVLVGDYRSRTWFPLVNLNHNGFHTWRLDHLTHTVAAAIPNFNFAERPAIGLLILLFGTYIFVRRCDGDGSLGSPLAWGASTFAVGCIVLITGLDPVVIGAVAWLPLVAFAIHASMTSSRPTLPLLALTVISIEAAYSANQAALLSAATAVWLAYLLALTRSGGPHQVAMTCVLAFFPALIVTVTTPMADLPPYPRSAHVLPYDETYQTLRPLLGAAYPFDTVDRTAVRSLYATGSFILFVLAILAWWVRRRHQTAVARYTGKVGLVLALVAFLNTCLPEPFATISPLPSLARMLPWGTSYSVTSVTLGLSAWMTVTSLVLNMGAFSLVPLASGAVALFVAGSPYIQHPILRTSGLASDESQRPLILSPSAAIIRSFVERGTNIAQTIAALRAGAHLPAKDTHDLAAQVEIQSASSQPLTAQGLPAEPSWRWSTRTGTQRGDEVLTIRFSAPLEVHGVELDPGPYATDYPRGLRISGGPCDRASARVLADYPVWQGTLKVLTRGIPYYSPRNEVRAVFPSPSVVSCLFAEQTGRANFDWSISRVKILTR